MLKGALLVSAGILIGVGANAVLAQSNAPSYMVAEINVKDQAVYEASAWSSCATRLRRKAPS